MTRSTSESGAVGRRLPARLERVRRRSAGILLVAVAGLLSAVGYGLVAAWQLAEDPNMSPDGQRPTGFADHVASAAVNAHFFGGQELLLLAVALLAGCLMLTRQAPPPSAAASRRGRPATAAPPLPAVAVLAAAAGLLALVFVAAAALALTSKPPDLPAAALRSILVADLALGLATLGVLTVLLSWWVPVHRPTDKGVQEGDVPEGDVQEGQDEDVADLAATPALAYPSDLPHQSPPEVIDSRQRERLGPTRQP